MDDTLKSLLDTETAASKLIEEAQAASERLVQMTVREARQQEERFQARIPELHTAFVDKSDQRAQQSVAEMERRFHERLTQLREDAEAHEDQALEAAFQQLLHIDHPDRT